VKLHKTLVTAEYNFFCLDESFLYLADVKLHNSRIKIFLTTGNFVSHKSKIGQFSISNLWILGVKCSVLGLPNKRV